MLVHKPAIERIKEGKFSGEHFYNLLEEMAQDAEDNGMESSHICISYLEEEDEFVAGTYVPEIHLILRRVEDEPVQPDQR